MNKRTKLTRRCPACKVQGQHAANREMVPYAGKILDGHWCVSITCNSCGHSWAGRFVSAEWVES